MPDQQKTFKMKQLTETIQKLKAKANFAVLVTETSSGNRLAYNENAAALIEKYGSVEAFFEKLAANKKDIEITLRRKNGSVFQKYQAPFILALSQMPIENPTPAPSKTAAVVPFTYDALPMPGLNGGLMAQQQFYHAMDYTRVNTECERYRSENDALKTEVARLKESALESRFSDSKANGTKDMLSGLMQYLPQIVSAVKGTPAAPGLNAPAATAAQQQLLNIIPTLDDDVCQMLLVAAMGISQNDDFSDKLYTLMQDFNLIPKQPI